MAFCEDCEKRATCKQMCRELKEHLAHTCRSKSSPRDAEMPGETIEELAAYGRVRLIWPRELQEKVERYPYHGLPRRGTRKS